jgi:hypothetical protein
VDILTFQTQTLEVHKELESTQRSLFNKVEAIQNHFQVVNQSLDNICLKEREVIAARTNFQEAVVSSGREGVSMVSRLSVSEQIIGSIILKTWETNIAEMMQEHPHFIKRASAWSKEHTAGQRQHIYF